MTDEVIPEGTPLAVNRAPPKPVPCPVPLKRAAIISDDGVYRYCAGRQWDTGLPFVSWIMLNPSTADAEVDDPTVRRCVEFSKRWGFGTLNIANLYALRATEPSKLRTYTGDPVGPRNDECIAQVCAAGSVIILAWGTGSYSGGRVAAVWEIIKALPVAKLCLGVTKDGSPRHPLYVRGDTRLSHWAVK